MTKIKFCGLSRPCDIAAANACRPAYVGFVFASASRRYVPPERAEELRALLMPEIRAVGVFVNEKPERIARIADRGIIDLIQLSSQFFKCCHLYFLLSSAPRANSSIPLRFISLLLHSHRSGCNTSRLPAVVGLSAVPALVAMSQYNIFRV